MDLLAIFDLYASRGRHVPDAGGVSALQHGWQCARLARSAGAAPALQLAAWLHDMGHLLDDAASGDAHETRAAALLLPLFGPRVSEPVALHVQAKRCLVATKPEYRRLLSTASLHSLGHQGGPLPIEQARAFLQRPHAPAAMRLRLWDDVARNPQVQPPSVAAALDGLLRLMRLLKLPEPLPAPMPASTPAPTPAQLPARADRRSTLPLGPAAHAARVLHASRLQSATTAKDR